MSKARDKKLPRGAKTPSQEFVVPILAALEETGGIRSATEVKDIVGNLMADTLNEVDLSRFNSGVVRWRNTAQRARLRMKTAGILAADSPLGIWEITERVRAYLREHRGK